MSGYLRSNLKEECFGCEACTQVCGKSAIIMKEDEEGFRYPVIDENLCVHCGLCNVVCPYENMPESFGENKYVFGGYSLNEEIRFESTSGGIFSEIVNVYCDDNYSIFGAEAKGLSVFHSYITDKKELAKFRKSKYSQSIIGNSYKQARIFLNEGKKVLFSGTPCQIAGLKAYLRNTNQDYLLTVEVVCEGVPSPIYMRKYEEYLEKKYGCGIENLDYRYTDKTVLSHGKWDFEVMRTHLKNNKMIKKDRWFNPFWFIWLNHLMSRPSCYQCRFASQERIADISLGDLWGVHLYCPELYGDNSGASLAVANTEKGRNILLKAQRSMYGHELDFKEALRYQAPMRTHISQNQHREAFMRDLKSSMRYEEINKKWTKSPALKLLWNKYIWGNRQKIAVWNLKKFLRRRD